MTPIVVATVEDGFARLWFRDTDGGLHQTANVLVGPTEPAELAAIASDMNERFAWAKLTKARNGAPVAAQPAEKPRQIQRRASGPDRLKRSKREIETFDQRVLSEIQINPNTTIPVIARIVLGNTEKNAQSNVRASIARLMHRGALIKHESVEQGKPHSYSAAPAATGSLGADDGGGGSVEQPDESP